MQEDTIGKLADSANAIAVTAGKAIDAGVSLGCLVKGPIERMVGIINDQLDFLRAAGQLHLQDKALEPVYDLEAGYSEEASKALIEPSSVQ